VAAVRVTDSGVPVDTLIGVVKDAVKRANVSRNSSPGDLRVASVQLKLAVVASKSSGGGMNFRVPFIGMKLTASARVSAKDTHTIDITLEPPQKGPRREVRGDVEQVLVQAITTIRDVMASAAAGDDPWVLKTSQVDISFAVTKTGTISLGAEGELASEVTNTLRLALEPGDR
jgi:hypothetical protein